MAPRVKHEMEETGILISHEKQCLPMISDMVRDFKPELIIELGTLHGGFTYVLHKSSEESELHTFDINKRKSIKKELYGPNVYFHAKCDILNSINKDLVMLLKSKKKKLLYCDNGKKEQEINMYAKYLNIGDMLGTHDWGREVRYENIANTLKVFSPHDINKVMEENKCMSRFWIRNI